MTNSCRKRFGSQIITEMVGSTTTTTWVEYDYLDRKTIDEASDNYERVFVILRDALKERGYDDEDIRLSVTQDLTDLLRQNCLISKEKK